MGATTTVELVGAAIVLGLSIAVGVGDVARLLDFLIDALLQKGVKLLHFSFDLGDVGEFDFNRRAEAVAAVLWQTELFAVVGAEFDGHDVGCVVVC